MDHGGGPFRSVSRGLFFPAPVDGIRRLRAVRTTGEPVTRPITALWRGGARDLSGAGRELIEVAVALAQEEAARRGRAAR